MSQLPISPQPGSAGRANQAGTEATTSSTASSQGGPAFRALLERLEAQADSLREVESGVDDVAGLGRAVEAARASFDDARELKSQLLEAFRQAEHSETSSTDDVERNS